MAAKKSKKTAASPKHPAPPKGDELVRQVLATAAIPIKTADAEQPVIRSATLLLEAERAVAAYRKARASFVKVPTFDAALADAARDLLEHAAATDGAWQKVRFAKQKGEGRGAIRKQAEALRSNVLRTARFFFRNEPARLLEVDRIAEGDGLPDLIRDLDDLAELARAHAALFAEAPKLGDVPNTAATLAGALRDLADPLPAAELLAARNRAMAALGVALREIRAAARFVYDGDPKALGPYATTTAARVRATRAKRKGGEKPTPSPA